MPSAWVAHVKSFYQAQRKKDPKYKYSSAMKDARASYKKGGDAKGKDAKGKDDEKAPAKPKRRRKKAAAKAPAKKARKGKKKMFQRRKVCRFCADKRVAITYKEPKTLRLFISETGKVTPRRISGTCAKHQRTLAVAIKRARQIAYLPYAPSHM